MFENPTLLGILDTSVHLANLILTDKFHVKSWVSYQNVVIAEILAGHNLKLAKLDIKIIKSQCVSSR